MNDLASTTSPANPSALPDAWIDRLFLRLSAMYGKHWLDLWADVPMAEVKAVWAADLRFVSGLTIAAALEHLAANSKFPPTCPEFVGLCRQFTKAVPAPVREPTPMLPAPPIAHLDLTEVKGDGRDWARRILKRQAAGEHLPLMSMTMATDALNAPPDAGAA